MGSLRQLASMIEHVHAEAALAETALDRGESKPPGNAGRSESASPEAADPESMAG